MEYMTFSEWLLSLAQCLQGPSWQVTILILLSSVCKLLFLCVDPPTDTRVLSMNKNAKKNDSINCHMQVLVWLFGFIFLGFIPRGKKFWVTW